MKYICLLALTFFFFISNKTFAQDLFRNTNPRNIKVDQISDTDLVKYLQQIKARGITQQQAEQIAISRGMPFSEIQKLRQRIQKLNVTPATNAPRNNLSNQQGNLNRPLLQPGMDTTSLNVDTTTKALKPLIDPKIFGSELFNN